jgi:hypothetical protein
MEYILSLIKQKMRLMEHAKSESRLRDLDGPDKCQQTRALNLQTVQKAYAKDQFNMMEFGFKLLHLINLHNPFVATTSGAEHVLWKLRLSDVFKQLESIQISKMKQVHHRNERVRYSHLCQALQY